MAKYLNNGKYNHLCPEDYVKMIKQFINSNKKYTKDDIFYYCIANSPKLDDGDEIEIKRLIDNSLKTFGKRVEKRNDVYYTIAPVNDIIVFDDDDIPKMNISAKTIENLNKIQGKSMNFDFWDENEVVKIEKPKRKKLYIKCYYTMNTGWFMNIQWYEMNKWYGTISLDEETGYFEGIVIDDRYKVDKKLIAGYIVDDMIVTFDKYTNMLMQDTYSFYFVRSGNDFVGKYIDLQPNSYDMLLKQQPNGLMPTKDQGQYYHDMKSDFEKFLSEGKNYDGDMGIIAPINGLLDYVAVAPRNNTYAGKCIMKITDNLEELVKYRVKKERDYITDKYYTYFIDDIDKEIEEFKNNMPKCNQFNELLYDNIRSNKKDKYNLIKDSYNPNRVATMYNSEEFKQVDPYYWENANSTENNNENSDNDIIDMSGITKKERNGIRLIKKFKTRFKK